MTRAERLQQAQAALFVGFGDGALRIGREAEASEWYRRATVLRPAIREELRTEMYRDGARKIYGDARVIAETATDNELVKA